jgi:GNAT superfamily N-acetyltransferase
MDRYCIRPLEPADYDAIQSLYATVRGREATEEWFTWKFEQNPFPGRIGMFVAAADGEIAGVRGCLRVPIQAGNRTGSAIYLLNMMVHPDHRGQGISSQLTERVIEQFSGDSLFLFALANENSRPIYDHWGWTLVTDLQTWYRVQDPARIAATIGTGRTIRVLGQAGTTATRGYLGFRDRLARWNRPADAETTVHRHSQVPATELASLYRQQVPSQLHLRQDEAFYAWRLDSPDWKSTVYTAERAGTPIAAIVTRTRRAFGGVTLTHLADVVPMTSEGTPIMAFDRLLSCITQDHSSSSVLAATDTALPQSLLRAHGFIPDDLPVISHVRTPHTLVAWDLDCGVNLADESNWLLPLAIRETS